MTKATAKELSDLMVSLGEQLDRSLAQVRAAESEAEFLRYREPVSKLLFIMLTEVMNPIYAEHPELKPEKLK